MKVISLNISKRENYDSEYPNEIVGTVQLSGDTGKMEIRLPPSVVCEIFKMCRESAQSVANANASQVSSAIDNEASNIALLAENGDLKQVEAK